MKAANENPAIHHLQGMTTGSLIAMAIMVTVWELAIYVLPGGRWIALVNVGFFLMTALMAVSLKNQIDLLFLGWVAWPGAITAWMMLIGNWHSRRRP